MMPQTFDSDRVEHSLQLNERQMGTDREEKRGENTDTSFVRDTIFLDIIYIQK